MLIYVNLCSHESRVNEEVELLIEEPHFNQLTPNWLICATATPCSRREKERVNYFVYFSKIPRLQTQSEGKV